MFDSERIGFLRYGFSEYLFPKGIRRMASAVLRPITGRRRTREYSEQLNDRSNLQMERDLNQLPPEEWFDRIVYRKGLRGYVLKEARVVEEDWAAVERHMHEAVASALGLSRGAPLKVLEFGCASGRNLFWLKKEYPHLTLVGVEISGQARDLGQRLSARFGLPVEFGRVRDGRIPQPDGAFDAAFTKFCLEQCPYEYPAIVAELLRVTKGRVVLLEPMEEMHPLSFRGLLGRLHGFYHNYSRGLYGHLRRLPQFRQARRLGWAVNPFNEPTLAVMEN